MESRAASVLTLLRGAVVSASLAEALAECRAAGVDLRVSGKGMSDCVDRVAPFCVGGTDGVRVDISRELPFCVSEALGPAKAAAELREAELRQAALSLTNPSPWFFVVGGLALSGLLYAALSD